MELHGQAARWDAAKASQQASLPSPSIRPRLKILRMMAWQAYSYHGRAIIARCYLIRSYRADAHAAADTFPDDSVCSCFLLLPKATTANSLRAAWFDMPPKIEVAMPSRIDRPRTPTMIIFARAACRRRFVGFCRHYNGHNFNAGRHFASTISTAYATVSPPAAIFLGCAQMRVTGAIIILGSGDIAAESCASPIRCMPDDARSKRHFVPSVSA